jgi:hypothetical protein
MNHSIGFEGDVNVNRVHSKFPPIGAHTEFLNIFIEL